MGLGFRVWVVGQGRSTGYIGTINGMGLRLLVQGLCRFGGFHDDILGHTVQGLGSRARV